MDVSGSRVALVLHVATAEDGGWSVQADFPQLHRNRMPFAEVSLDDGELRFRSRSLGAFAGRMSDDGERLAGMLGDGAAGARSRSTVASPHRPHRRGRSIRWRHFRTRWKTSSSTQPLVASPAR